MACNKPILAWQSELPNENGKYPVVFKPGIHSHVVCIPCGKCIACKLEKSMDWALRMMHEKRFHEESIFLTLTYDDKNCPDQLNKRDWQLFMKSLRNKYPERTIRYYMCGEYGELLERPHYHAIMFGINFNDRQIHKKGQYTLWKSEKLNKVWGKGYAIFGEVNMESCAYTARYVTKKITGEKAKEHYNGKQPEFALMSRRPGIGTAWYEKYGTHALRMDMVTMKGKKIRVPKYYMNKLEKTDITQYQAIKARRKIAGLDADANWEQLKRNPVINEVKVRKFERYITNNAERFIK